MGARARARTGASWPPPPCIALPLDEASVKVRAAPAGDDEADLADLDRWAGVLPVRTEFGEPDPCPTVPSDHEVPAHVAGRRPR